MHPPAQLRPWRQRCGSRVPSRPQCQRWTAFTWIRLCGDLPLIARTQIRSRQGSEPESAPVAREWGTPGKWKLWGNTWNYATRQPACTPYEYHLINGADASTPLDPIRFKLHAYRGRLPPAASHNPAFLGSNESEPLLGVVLPDIRKPRFSPTGHNRLRLRSTPVPQPIPTQPLIPPRTRGLLPKYPSRSTRGRAPSGWYPHRPRWATLAPASDGIVDRLAYQRRYH